MTERDTKEFNFGFQCFLKQRLMLPVTCCFLKIKLQTAAMKNAFDDFFSHFDTLLKVRQLRKKKKTKI